MNPEDIATKQDIVDLTAQIASLTQLVQKLVGTTASEIFSLSQVERMGVLGGYDRIKRLIRNGHLKSIDGKKITRQALDECLTAQNSKPITFTVKNISNAPAKMLLSNCDMLQGCVDAKKEIETLKGLSGQSVPTHENYKKGYPTIVKSFFKTGGLEWEKIKVLDWDKPKWADDMPEKFCNACPIAAYAHPCVQDPKDEHSYFKLCTLELLKEELITIDEVFEDVGGCGADSDDRAKLEKMLGIKSDPTPAEKEISPSLEIQPTPLIDIDQQFHIASLHKKPFTIVAREFNPQGMPNSNSWYYVPSFDKHRRFKEDYLLDFLSNLDKNAGLPNEIIAKKTFKFLDQMKWGPMGGTITNIKKELDFFNEMEKLGLIKMDNKQPSGIYQCELTPKGRKVRNKLESEYI